MVGPNVLYERSVPACRTCAGGGVRDGYCPAGVWVGGCRGGVLPTTHPAPSIGIARAQPLPLARITVSPGHSGPSLGPSAHPGSRTLRYPPWSQYRRDSGVYILKLVNYPECHRFSLMRPVILPICKTGPEVTTLNFQENHIGQPSLPRNKWSCICLTAKFIVKTAKCRPDVHQTMRG